MRSHSVNKIFCNNFLYKTYNNYIIKIIYHVINIIVKKYIMY